MSGLGEEGAGTGFPRRMALMRLSPWSFPLLPSWVMVWGFLLEPPAPPPTLPPVSMTKWKESEEKPPRRPQQMPPALPSCPSCPEPSLPVLKPPAHTPPAPHGGWAPAMLLLNLPAYLVITNSKMQLTPPTSPSLPPLTETALTWTSLSWTHFLQLSLLLPLPP